MGVLSTSTPQLVLGVGLLLFLSILANRISDRSGVPMLLLFLGLGMLAGSDGLGGIHFNDPALANLVGVFALSFILFSGGLDTDWRRVRPVLGRALALSTAGVALTAGLVGVFVWKVAGYSLKEGLLIGAIVSSTDAAAVFSIMRARGVGLKGQLKPLLELESGSNDPMAVFLTTAVLGLIVEPGRSWVPLAPSLLLRMSVGIAAGVAVGAAASLAFDRLRLAYEGMYSVLSMSLVLLAYGLSESLSGNGFMAVYVCGIVLASKDFQNKRFLARFHDGLGWLMQVVLFLVLGLLVFPSKLPKVAGLALLVSSFLMFVARPLAVHVCLWRSRFSMAERTLASWTGLRGAVPIVLATYPYLAGYERSDVVFDIVFFIVLTSVLLQGKTLMTVARWLKVDKPARVRLRPPIEFEKRAGLHSEMREIDVPTDAAAAGKPIAELGLPEDALIVLIRRGADYIVPKGQTAIEPYDTLLVIAGRDSLPEVQTILSACPPDAPSCPSTGDE